MTGRTQEPPAGRNALPILAGTYHYGENRFGPRQLTSVVRDCVEVLGTYHYDGAGRMDKDGKKDLTYDGYDQLTSVTENGAALVNHAYGYDGLRTYTKGAGNNEQYWFASDDTLLPGGTTRWHYISVGDRLVARRTFSHPSSDVAFPPSPASVAWWPDIERKLPRYFVTSTAAGMLLLLGLAAWRRRRPLWQTAPAVACSGFLVLTTPGCDHSDLEKRQQGIENVDARRYFHQGVAAGPTMITKGDGSVVDERRFEPFGEPIDANMGLDPYNSLNKERNAETGWSYHGARWMAPQTARWMTPDPPAKGPDAKFMGEPWGLNPYSYVKQSPTMYWDPKGLEEEENRKTLVLYSKDGLQSTDAIKEAIGNNRTGYENSLRTTLTGILGKQKLGGVENADFKPVATAKDIENALAAGKQKYDRVIYCGHVFDGKLAPSGDKGDRLGAEALKGMLSGGKVATVGIIGCSSEGIAKKIRDQNPGIATFGVAGRIKETVGDGKESGNGRITELYRVDRIGAKATLEVTPYSASYLSEENR